MKYIDADQLKAEIDKRYTEYRAKMKTDDFTYYEGMADALDLFEQHIDSLPEQSDGYNRAMLEVKAKIDKLYDETSIGLNEYDAGLYNGIAETCMKLRGFVKARISSPEQPVLPGIDEEGIPGKDFIPVEWVDTCERYGKWKIVKRGQAEKDTIERAKQWIIRQRGLGKMALQDFQRFMEKGFADEWDNRFIEKVKNIRNNS